MDAITVLIVDDHAMVAEGLSEALAAGYGIEVVGRAATAGDAHRLAGVLSPDVVVMDYRLPDADGATTAELILRDNPSTAVVMVTASDHDSVIAAAIGSGCVGYVCKDRAAREVVTAVRSAARGEVTFPAWAIARMIPRMRDDATPRSAGLTRRQLEVLRMLAAGRSTEQMAEELFLSPSTVRNHVHNVIQKLGAHSKLQAVTIAVGQGIVSYAG